MKAKGSSHKNDPKTQSSLTVNSTVDSTVDLCALVLLLIATSVVICNLWALGLRTTPDSITYYISSLAIQAGNGIRQGLEPDSAYLTHYPPLIPICLALLQKVTSGINAFLIINSTSLMITIIILFILSKRIFESSAIAFLIASAYLTHPSTFDLYRSGFSEPLYMLFTFTTLLFVTQKKITAVGISAVFAILTRYAGAHFLAFFPLLYFLRQDQNWNIRSIIFITGLPFVALTTWMIRNFVVASEVSSRSFVQNSIDITLLFNELTQTATLKWACLGYFQETTIIGALILVFPLFGFLYKQSSNLSLCYLTSLGLIVASRLFVDAEIPMNERILFVPFTMTLILAIGLPGLLLKNSPVAKGALGVSGAVLLAIATFQQPSLPKATAFESSSWQDMKAINYLKKLPPSSITIFTNARKFLFLHADIPSKSLPRKFVAGTREEDPASLPKFIEELLPDKEIYLAFFSLINWRWYLWTEQELIQNLPLEKVFASKDATIYKLTRTTKPQPEYLPLVDDAGAFRGH